MKQFNYEPNFYHQNTHTHNHNFHTHNNDHYISQNNTGHIHDNIVTQNLNKYNSPPSPYSPCT
jgi:hypothetical protein